MARRRGRKNPGTGFWVAAALGTAAVGGLVYVMTRPKTAATSTTPAVSTTTNPESLGPAATTAPATVTG